MKNKKIIHILIFFLILPYQFFITPNLMERTLKHSVFNHIKLPESSTSEIKIITPENNTYYNAMDGYYPATYGFDSGTQGDTSSNDWRFISNYGYTYPKIWDEFEGHKKVVGINDTRTDDRPSATHNVGMQSNGTVELWILGINTNKAFYILFRGPIDSDLYTGIFLKITNGSLYFFRYSDILITSLDNNTWYHLRIDFECGNGKYQNLSTQEFKLQITPEGGMTQYYGPYSLYEPVEVISEVEINADYSQSGSEYFFDAFAYSWDPHYDIGDNKDPGLFVCFEESMTMQGLYYSLDGQNVSIHGNHTIRMPADGLYSIQIFGTSSGQPYRSDIRFFTVNLYKPGEVILNTSAQEPDLDGVFNLTWTQIGVANNYTLYEHHEPIMEINQDLTILATNITNKTYTMIRQENEVLFYKLVAFNRYGNSSSSYLSINVHLTPLLYNDFQVNYMYHSHFKEIILTWTNSPNVDNYSIYKSKKYITGINDDLTLVESGLKKNSFNITQVEEGIFYYIVVAYNEFGYSISNCASIRLGAPPREEPNNDTLIIFLIIMIMILISVIISITLIGGSSMKRIKRELKQKEGVVNTLKDLRKKKNVFIKEDIPVFKEKHYCLVHKGSITGYTFVCPHCGAYYCMNCINALEVMERICWACEKPLKQIKPIIKHPPTKSDKNSALKKYQNPK